MPIDQLSVTTNNPLLSTIGDNQAAVIKVGFTWTQAIPNGTIEVLLQSAKTGGNDGQPDVLTYDFGNYSSLPVQCPLNLPGYTFDNNGQGISAASSVAVGGLVFHRFACHYTGSGSTNVDISQNPIIIGNSLTSLINPIGSPQHQAGLDAVNSAEAPVGLIRFLDENGNVLFSREIIPSLNLSGVHVSARVVPELYFKIIGLNQGGAACGLITTDTTTGTSVDFTGVIPNAFSIAAQKLEVGSSAHGGYVVTVSQNDQLKLATQTDCPGVDAPDNRDCIPDAVANSMSPTTTAAWTNATTDHGFAYTLEKLTDAPISGQATAFTGAVDFNYTEGYRQFADRSAAEKPVRIAYNNDVTNRDWYYVCYKLSVSPKNHFGAYQNSLNYVITATF